MLPILAREQVQLISNGHDQNAKLYLKTTFHIRHKSVSSDVINLSVLTIYKRHNGEAIIHRPWRRAIILTSNGRPYMGQITLLLPKKRR